MKITGVPVKITGNYWELRKTWTKFERTKSVLKNAYESNQEEVKSVKQEVKNVEQNFVLNIFNKSCHARLEARNFSRNGIKYYIYYFFY